MLVATTPMALVVRKTLQTDAQGLHRLRENQSAQGDLRQRRHRLDLASHLSPLHASDEDGDPARALPRPVAGRERPAVWADRHDVRPGRLGNSAHCLGRREADRGHGAEPGCCHSERADLDRGGPAGAANHRLDRAVLPKGTPKPIVERVNAALDKAMRDETIAKRLADSWAPICPRPPSARPRHWASWSGARSTSGCRSFNRRALSANR